MKTGYPSIDKPWLKYYSKTAINAKIPDCSIYEYLLKCNQAHFDEPAILYFDRVISFRELFQLIDRAAGAFTSAGVKSGEVVSVLSLSTPETIVCIYALNKIGALISMEPITQTNQLLERSLLETKTKVVVVLDMFFQKYAETLTKLPLKKVVVLDTLTRQVDFTNLPYEIYCPFDLFCSAAMPLPTQIHEGKGNEPAVIVQTSGTTAIPKKVLLTNQNINSVALQYGVANFNFIRGETFLEIVPPHLSVGFTLQMHTPLCLGLCSIIGLNSDPQKVVEMFVKYDPNNFMAGIAHVKAIASSPISQKMDLSKLRNYAIGGESIPENERREIDDYLKKCGAHVKLMTGYGMTELSSSVIAEQPNAQNPKSIGIPLSHVTAKVVDLDSGEEVTYGKTGELLISSPSVMLGYMNNEEETNRAIEIDADGTRWLHTGDIGYIDEDGFAYIVGRLKRIFQTFDVESNMIFKMYPDYIESEIDSCPIVNRAAVIAIEDERLINKAVAVVELKEKIDDPITIIKNYVLSRLEPYNRPVEYIVLDELPLLQNGKVDYRQLNSLYEKSKPCQ